MCLVRELKTFHLGQRAQIAIEQRTVLATECPRLVSLFVSRLTVLFSQGRFQHT